MEAKSAGLTKASSRPVPGKTSTSGPDFIHGKKLVKKDDVIREEMSRRVMRIKSSVVNKEGKASSENMTLERDAPSSEEVEDSVSILRKKAEGRIFPGTSWFDGNI